ncbi:hypothetical protein F5B20DRAFT_577186 [Whalleya microplaca]|nr:hypothetical protein F5B20DRAFT_577186 [Whalleya microplaca]
MRHFTASFTTSLVALQIQILSALNYIDDPVLYSDPGAYAPITKLEKLKDTNMSNGSSLHKDYYFKEPHMFDNESVYDGISYIDGTCSPDVPVCGTCINRVFVDGIPSNNSNYQAIYECLDDHKTDNIEALRPKLKLSKLTEEDGYWDANGDMPPNPKTKRKGSSDGGFKYRDYKMLPCPPSQLINGKPYKVNCNSDPTAVKPPAAEDLNSKVPDDLPPKTSNSSSCDHYSTMSSLSTDKGSTKASDSPSSNSYDSSSSDQEISLMELGRDRVPDTSTADEPPRLVTVPDPWSPDEAQEQDVCQDEIFEQTLEKSP